MADTRELSELSDVKSKNYKYGEKLGFVFVVVLFCLYKQLDRRIQGSLEHITLKHSRGEGRGRYKSSDVVKAIIFTVYGFSLVSQHVFHTRSQMHSFMLSLVGFITLFLHLNL